MSKQARILYIEDDDLDRRAFLRMVREKGLPWDIHCADTLAAARALLAETHFDVIVADYHLPDGESTCLFGEIPDTPFVLLTGTLEEQLALRTLERGADDYLIKDPEHRVLEALPFAVEKTLHRKSIHEKEQRLTRELRQSEQRLRATFENAASGIAELNAEDRLISVNDRLCQMLGYAREELLGMSVHDLTYPEDRPRTQELGAQLHDGRLSMFQHEKRYLKRDGSLLWAHVGISAVRDEAGRYLYTVGTVVDISARKAAEAQVRLQVAALEAAPNAISLSKTDPEGTIVWVNPAFTKLTGYSVEEAVGRSHHILSSGLQDAAFYRGLWATVERGEVWRGELVNRRKDGALYYEEMGITPLRDEDGKMTHYVAIKQDITARKQAEEALRESELKFRVLAENAPVIFGIIQGNGFVYANRCLAETSGYTVEEIMSMDFSQLVHPDYREVVTERARQRIEGELAPSRYELVMLTKAGEARWLELSPAVIEYGGKPAIIGAALDITDRKKAEEEIRAAKAAAEESSRAKDQFLAVLSHELRTPLTPVLASVSMLQKNPFFDERTHKDLEMIRRNVELEARLIDDLLDVTRIARGKVELDKHPVEICSVIGRAVDVCRPDIEARRLHFGVDLGNGAPYVVEADIARLQQVFWNLLKNAIKFTPHGGCVGIRCHADNGEVVAEVNDTGMGIEPEVLPRLFNAFAQADRGITRQFGGLGSWAGHQQITHRTARWLDRGLQPGQGKGATFRVHLPLAAKSSLTGQPPAPAPELRQQRVLRLLVVEDHGDTAEMIKLMLESEGHQVELAGDVETALERASQAEFDLLISDLGLPDGSGLDLMRELRTRGHQLPGIALSGYGQEEDVQRSREAGFIAHVIKPVDTDKLAAVLADVSSHARTTRAQARSEAAR